MQITTLGPVAVDGVPVAGRRVGDLLRALAARGGGRVPVTVLVDEVWGDDPPADEAGALQALVARLRRLGVPVETVADGYALGAQAQVDAVVVDRLATAAQAADRAGDAAAAARLAGQARAALGGTPDLTDPVAVRLLSRVTEVTASTAAATGEPPPIDDLRALAQLWPPDEPMVALLVRALAGQGRQAEALQVVDDVRRALRDTLGADPSPVLAAAHLAVLRGELEVGVRPPVPTTRRGHDRRPAAWRRTHPLLGRADDVAQVDAALQQAAVVSVVAPGGAGKTTLAAHVAAAWVQQGRAVRVVELAGVRDQDDVPAAVLAALGGEPVGVVEVVEPRHRGTDERLRATLADVDGLLVLDNCEHLLDAVAAQVVRVLDAAEPGLAVLVTSRAPLAVPGEHVHRLGALTDDEALALLTARARAAGAGTTWDESAARQLVHRLDNLPLALELAGARLRSMPLDDVLAGLTDRFGLLDDALRGLPDRHASLWAMVDWSWALLDADAQALLRRTAAIPSSFGAAAARATGGLSPARTRTALATLVDQSLLTLDDEAGEPRYRMLETVREYGEVRLDAVEEREQALDGLARWAVELTTGLLDGLVGHAQVATVDTARRDQDALVAVLRRAVDHVDEPVTFPVAAVLFWTWMVRGLHEEVESWASRLLHLDAPALRAASPALTGAPGPRADPQAELLTGLVAFASGGFGPSLRTLAVVRRMLRRTLAALAPGVEPRMAQLGRVLLEMWPAGDPDEVMRRAAGALVTSEDDYLRALGLFLHGALVDNGAASDRAIALAEESYALFAKVGDEWGMGMVAQSIGQWITFRDTAAALTWLSRGVTHLERLDATPDLGNARVMLDVARAMGGDADAVARLERLEAEAGVEPVEAAQAALALAALDLREGRSPAAHARRALDLVPRMRLDQARVVVEAGALVALLRAEPPGAAPDELRRRVVALLAPAASTADQPVLGTVALVGAELAWHDGDDDRARTLWAIGSRLGASAVPGFDPDLVPGLSAVLGDTTERTARRDALGPLSVAQARARLADLVR